MHEAIVSARADEKAIAPPIIDFVQLHHESIRDAFYADNPIHRFFSRDLLYPSFLPTYEKEQAICRTKRRVSRVYTERSNYLARAGDDELREMTRRNAQYCALDGTAWGISLRLRRSIT
jgi:hypothetical protein